MTKLSALLTWIVVVAFTMATTTATERCRFNLNDDANCSAADVAELVKLMNMKLQKQWGITTRTRDLNDKDTEASPASLRGAHAQNERELACIPCTSCNGQYGCLVECSKCVRRRGLQSFASSSNAAKFGELITSNLGTFGWDKCNPSKLKFMNCTDV